MKKKLFSLILLFSFFYFNISFAVHEQYYIEELKGDENVIYNTLIKKYNKWNDESEADYSCNDLPVTFSLPVDIADCHYRKTTKYINQYLRDYSCVERNTPLNEKRLVSILKNIIHQRIEIIWGCLD